MHEHKHNQCKRKVKHRKNVMKLIIFCITVGISLMFIYYQNLRKEIDVRQKWLETVLTGEKKWILENQGPEGEFYMNGSKAGDVNPYFSCIAALGLLAETKNCPITETEKKAVGRYLDWHTGILLETDGKMGLCCFDPDLLEERLKRSDRDIIEQGLAKGVYIEDAEEYLAKLGR